MALQTLSSVQEAVSSIVQKYFCNKSPVLRDTYLRECSNRTNMKELTLMYQMNRNIYSSREQLNRERQRISDAQGEQKEEGLEDVHQELTVEDMLVQAVIKDGERVIFRDVKDENSGQTYNLTVAQYIAYDLSSDNLGFSNELYTKRKSATRCITRSRNVLFRFLSLADSLQAGNGLRSILLLQMRY